MTAYEGGPQDKWGWFHVVLGTVLFGLPIALLGSGIVSYTDGSVGPDTKLMMGRMSESLATYAAAHHQQYPDTLEDAALYFPNGAVPGDPWGNPFVYTKLPDGEYRIVSYGADGEPGGEGEDADIDSRDP